MGLAAVTWLEFVAGVQSVAHGGNAGSRSRAAVGLGSPTGPQPNPACGPDPASVHWSHAGMA